MTVEGLIEAASLGKLTTSGIQQLVATEADVPPTEVLDRLARAIANGYRRGEYDFNTCNAVMNEVFAYAHHETETGLSRFAWGVFEAFDQGEFRGEEVTRNLLSAVLSRGYLEFGDDLPTR